MNLHTFNFVQCACRTLVYHLCRDLFKILLLTKMIPWKKTMARKWSMLLHSLDNYQLSPSTAFALYDKRPLARARKIREHWMCSEWDKIPTAYTMCCYKFTISHSTIGVGGIVFFEYRYCSEPIPRFLLIPLFIWRSWLHMLATAMYSTDQLQVITLTL